ncbi:MAG: energy transducer TonB [Kiloniellaceae bacterium]
MTALSMRLRARHWGIALGGALVVHAGVALFFGRPAPSGAVAAGLDGIAVDLGTAGGSPGNAKALVPDAVPNDPAEVPEAEEVPPTEMAEVPPDNASEVPEVTAPEVPAPAPVEAAPAVAAAEVPLYAPAEPEVPDVAEVVPPVVAAPLTEPAEPEEIEAKAVMATPSPPPRKPRQPVREAEPAPAAPPAARPTEVATIDEVGSVAGPQVGEPSEDKLAGTDGKAGEGATANAGTARGDRAGGMPGQSADYAALLSAWLEKHKEYPRRAKLRRQEGTAQLHFVIDNKGQLLEFEIKESSGYKLLDDEVAAMVQRAAPMPVPPPGLGGDRFSYTVPVLFNQR